MGFVGGQPGAVVRARGIGRRVSQFGTLGDTGYGGGDLSPTTLAKTVAAATRSPGSALSSYPAWVAAVKAARGAVVRLEDRKAARYNATTSDLIKQVNSKAWAMPDRWSANGQEGYYFAPVAVNNDAAKYVEPTEAEVAKGADTLANRWWRELLKPVALTVAGGIGVAFLLGHVGGSRR